MAELLLGDLSARTTKVYEIGLSSGTWAGMLKWTIQRRHENYVRRTFISVADRFEGLETLINVALTHIDGRLAPQLDGIGENLLNFRHSFEHEPIFNLDLLGRR